MDGQPVRQNETTTRKYYTVEEGRKGAKLKVRQPPWIGNDRAMDRLLNKAHEV